MSAAPAPRGGGGDMPANRGGRLARRVEGRGPAMLFIHGVGLAKEMWRAQQRRFAAIRTTIAVDLPGHGQSAANGETLAGYSAALRAALDETGFERADLVGHSFGGLIALDFALRYPAQTGKIAVIAAVFCRTQAAREAAIARAESIAKPGGVKAAADAALLRWFGEDDYDSPQAAEVRGWLDNATGYAAAYRLFARADGEFEDRLHDLAAPALFAAGEDDPHSTPEMARQMAALAPDGQLCVFAGQRHLAPLLAPAAVNRVLWNFFADDGRRD